MRMLHLATRLVLLCVVAAAFSGCPRPPAELNAFIKFQMNLAKVPGLSACIVKRGEIVWTGAYGVEDTDTDTPVVDSTHFMLASVSKTVTATAVMQLYERGLIDLDADINTYLPFDVRNPVYPRQAITTRMLLAHASSIQDNYAVIEELYTDGDSPIALGYFLEEYLRQGGEYFRPMKSFYLYAPGEASNYSNVGMTLAGYIVEVVSGRPFDEFCEDNIFTPLGMDEAAWFLADLGGARIARPHNYRPLLRRYDVLEHYGYPDYPDGQLRASARAYGRFLAAFLGGGAVEGVRILEEETVEEMLTAPFPALDNTQAHGWFFFGGGAIGHTGGDAGVTTEAFFIPEEDVGIVLLSNGEVAPIHAGALGAIAERLLEEAEGL